MNTSGAMVHVVIVINRDGDQNEEHHIFSTAEKAGAFADAEPRPCLISTYVIDHPERMTERTQ